MHSASTRNDFLRLRIAGLSFARIARQLGVSKPTLIAWSRASQPELDSGRAEVQARLQEEVTNANQDATCFINPYVPTSQWLGGPQSFPVPFAKTGR